MFAKSRDDTMRISWSIRVMLAISAPTVIGRPSWARQSASPAPQGLSASSSTADSALLATDVFLGRGVVGPYILAWRNMEPASETVSRNGARLARGTDYDLDATAGVLSFHSALTARDIARIDYRYVPAKAAANSTIVAIPFGFRLLSDPQGALAMNAVFRPDLAGKPGQAQSGLGAMQLGFDGSYRPGKTSEVAGKLALDTRFGDLAQRAGILLTEKSTFRGGKLDLSMSRAGAGFLLADQTGIAAGKETAQGNLDLALLRGMKGTFGYVQTTDLPDTGSGATTTAVTQKLVGTIDKRTRYQANHATTDVHTPGSPDTSGDTTHLRLDRIVDTRTDLTALFDRSESDGPAGASITQSESLDVRSRPMAWLSITGRYQNRLLAGGAEDLGQFQIDAQPGKRTKINAAMADKLASTGGLHTREATVQYVPAGNLTLTSGFTLRSEGAQEAASQIMGATWKPGTFELGGNVRFREAAASGQTQADVPDTYDVRMSVGLRHTPLRLTGTWAENPEDAQGAVQRITRGGMGLKTTLGRLELSSDFLREYDILDLRTAETVSCQLGYSLRKGTRLTGEYRESRTRDTSLAATDTYSLALTHQVGSAIDLSLTAGLTQHLIDGLLQPDSEYRAETKLRLRF